MESHVKALGLLFILSGVFGALAGVTYFLLGGPATAAADGPISGYMITGSVVLMLILAVPSVIVGIGLLNLQKWSRSMATIVAILELLTFPIGTALGIYALWVLLSAETDPLFSPRFNETRRQYR